MKRDIYYLFLIIIAASLLNGCQKNSVKSHSEALNEDQKTYIEWTNRKFGSVTDSKYQNLSNRTKKEMEEIWLVDLKNRLAYSDYSCDYYKAINYLASIRSKKAFEPLCQIAFERREKDNRDRWMATRALGEIGDKRAVPELIHLTYHYNMNTRLWAQIALVKITGQNFEYDWKAWGQWWNAQDQSPPFNSEFVVWTSRSDLADFANIEKQKEYDKESIAHKRK